jgi:hypothetical protein
MLLIQNGKKGCRILSLTSVTQRFKSMQAPQHRPKRTGKWILQISMKEIIGISCRFPCDDVIQTKIDRSVNCVQT